MKKCNTCFQLKNLTDFGICKKNPDGLNYCCKFCRKIYQQNSKESIAAYNKQYRKQNEARLKKVKEHYRLKNKEHIKLQKKEYQINNQNYLKDYYKKWKETESHKKYTEQVTKYNKTLKGKYNKLKVSAKTRKLELTITFNEYCELLQDNKCFYAGCSLENTGGSSLNRIDSTKGYHINNVKPCCKTCNWIMNHFSKDILLERLEKIAIALKNT